MAMKTNPMRAALAAGRVQLGTWITLVRNPAVLTLLKSAGLDYVRIDMEHASPSIETVADMAALGRALDFPVVVRPPEGSRAWITRLLDAGVWGLHIPQVDTPAIARELGVLGTPDQGRVIDEHRARLLAAAARHGKAVARLVQTLDEAERWIRAGAKLIASASDAAVRRSGYAAAVRRLRPDR